MESAICIVPAAPVRMKASHKVEMANQILFGERMFVLREKTNWCKVRTMHDNYEGWIRNNLIAPNEVISVGGQEFVTRELFNVVDVNGLKMHISAGCNFPELNHGQGKIAMTKYLYKGYAINRNELRPGAEIARQFSMQWLNAPYLWGGRTPLGVDCSGFVQVIFKMMGLDLLRDAKEQARQGMKVKKLPEAQCGDLAFFEKKEKITHVGILLSPTRIIHASGKVRIDDIDGKGIINADTGKRTHSISAIRRYW